MGLAVVASVTSAVAQEPVDPTGTARLDAWIQARIMGVTAERFSGNDLGLDPMRASTGAGVSRWPKEPDGSSNFYLSTVGCRNDWLVPSSRRPSRAREGVRSSAGPSRPAPAGR
jgi:hypothetical protein